VVGRIRKIFNERGYSFIQVPGSKDIFLHANVLEDHSFRNLHEGDWVEFEVASLEGRLRATSAKLLPMETVLAMRDRGELEL
jgi:CspA family cold shock protein